MGGTEPKKPQYWQAATRPVYRLQPGSVLQITTPDTLISLELLGVDGAGNFDISIKTRSQFYHRLAAAGGN